MLIMVVHRQPLPFTGLYGGNLRRKLDFECVPTLLSNNPGTIYSVTHSDTVVSSFRNNFINTWVLMQDFSKRDAKKGRITCYVALRQIYFVKKEKKNIN